MIDTDTMAHAITDHRLVMVLKASSVRGRRSMTMTDAVANCMLVLVSETCSMQGRRCRTTEAAAMAGVERSASKCTFMAPSGFAREYRRLKSTGINTIGERRVASEGNVVEAEVPDLHLQSASRFYLGMMRIHYRSIDHTISRKRHSCSDDGSRDQIIPVMEFIDGESASNQGRAKDWSPECNHLPHCGVVVGPNLELGIEVKEQEDESRDYDEVVSGNFRFRVQDLFDQLTCSSSMSTWERF